MAEHSIFNRMVDDLVEFSEYDPELKEGLQWIDGQAQKLGISFYDMIFDVLYKYDVDNKAKKWLETRN